MSLLYFLIMWIMGSSLAFQCNSIMGFQDNEVAQALQGEFRRQDDGKLMILSKQSESTKVGLAAPDERARKNNCCAATEDFTFDGPRSNDYYANRLSCSNLSFFSFSFSFNKITIIWIFFLIHYACDFHCQMKMMSLIRTFFALNCLNLCFLDILLS